MILENFKMNCNEFNHVIDSLDSEYRNLLCDHETIKANLTPLLKEDERFRYIKGFPNYVVTDYGRVFNIIRLKELNPYRNRTYVGTYRLSRVGLYNKESQVYIYVHKLVADAFLDAPDSSIKDPVVDHIDHNTTNNHYTNLRWVSRSENSSNKVTNKYKNMSLEELLNLREKIRIEKGSSSSDYQNLKSVILYYKRKKLK